MSSLKWLALMLLLTAGIQLSADNNKIQATQITGVPFVKQENNLCGPAALAEVMAYYGVHDEQKNIAAAVFNPKFKGALITDLESYAAGKGFSTLLAQGKLEDIRTVIRRGHPVIVLADQGFWVFSQPHYLVVTGFDDQGFTVHAGVQTASTITDAEFQRIWSKIGSTYLLIWR